MASLETQLNNYNDKYDPINRTNTIVDAMDEREIFCPKCGENVEYTMFNDGRHMTLTVFCESDDCDFEHVDII